MRGWGTILRLVVALSALPLSQACVADFYGRGLTYSERGQHDVAVHYFIGAHRGEPGNEEIRKRMQDELVRATEMWTAKAERLEQTGDHSGALGAAKRVEDLSYLGAEMELPGFAPEQAAQVVAELHTRAAKDAVAAVDEATSNGADKVTTLTLLRTARALNPHDEDINARYLMLQESLIRYVRIVPKCSAVHRDLCLEIGHSVLRNVTAVNREFIVVVPDNAAKHNTDLVVQLEATMKDTGWVTKQRGTAVHSVKKLSDTKDVVKDKKGKAVKVKVKATYTVHQRTTSATVRVTMELSALEGGRTRLWGASHEGKQADENSYYDWSGDHRALTGPKSSWVLQKGTDRTPPTQPKSMARNLWTASTKHLSKAMIESLEATQ